MDPREEGATHLAINRPGGGARYNEHQAKFYWQQTDLERTTYARRECDWER